MRKFLHILLLLIIPFTTLFAQSEGGVVEGKVIDNKSKEPLGFVTIALIPDGATAPVAGCNSDDEGAFLISNVKAGKYKLRVSFVGYLDDTRSITVKKGERNNVGTVAIKPDNKLLKEIVVTEQRSQMSFEIDKTEALEADEIRIFLWKDDMSPLVEQVTPIN